METIPFVFVLCTLFVSALTDYAEAPVEQVFADPMNAVGYVAMRHR
jgi:hypothetical protein